MVLRLKTWAVNKGIILFVVTGSAFVVGSLGLKNYLLLLDWVPGPNFTLSFRSSSASIPTFPLGVALDALFYLLTVPWAQRLTFLAILTGAGVGVSRLLKPSSALTIPAAFLYMFNPFVYERFLAGQIGLLISYALLPFAFIVIRRHLRAPRIQTSMLLGLVVCLMIASDSHSVFLGAVLGMSLVAGAWRNGRRKAMYWIVPSVVTTALVSSYWLLPNFHVLTLLEAVGPSDIELFRTAADPDFGVLGNLLALYGFWHREWPLPKDGLPGWWLIFLGMFMVICIGAWKGLRTHSRRVISVTLLISGVAGFFLALGDQGPTGSIFLWMFEHVPGFKIMREPQKFLGLLVLAYAFFYGIGSEWLVNGFKRKWAKATMALILIALPCIYTYKMFWGFNGYVQPSTFPDSWYQADRLMGEGQEKALALPWHLYLAFPWTQNRVVANPMNSFFQRETIVGDNIEIGEIETQSTNPRSKYIEDVMARWMDTKNFGNLIAPLGVKYILLAKEADWMDYRWLEQQEDIRLVREWDDLRLYENMVAAPTAYSTDRKITFRNMDELVAAAAVVRLTDYAIEIDPTATSPPDLSHANAGPVKVKKHSPVDYELLGSGKGGYTVFTEPFDPEWAIGEERASANLGATNFFEVAPREGMRIKFLRWRLMLVGYSISGATLLAILVYWARTVVRRRRIVVPKLDPIQA